MSITLAGNTVNGDLMYNFFEKDRNTGKIQGTVTGDTINAKYEFQSEGMMSVREVSFIRSGSTLLDQTSGIELREVDCK